jgi:hypothetical protein
VERRNTKLFLAGYFNEHIARSDFMPSPIISLEAGDARTHVLVIQNQTTYSQCQLFWENNNGIAGSVVRRGKHELDQMSVLSSV